MWLRGLGSGLLSAVELLRLLGHFQWFGRPLLTILLPRWCLLGGASRQRPLHPGADQVSCRYAPFCYGPPTIHRQAGCGECSLFVDAALPRLLGRRYFTVGVVGPKGCYRSRRCPVWIMSMLQAELFALYMAAKIGAYEGHPSMCLDSDGDTARLQVLQQRAGAHCAFQNRLLGRLIWLCLWSGSRLILFRIATHVNPADPLSRMDFPQPTIGQEILSRGRFPLHCWPG